jgi:hypothetical protein
LALAWHECNVSSFDFAGFAVKELNDFHYATAATVDLTPVDPEAIAAAR